MISYKRVGAIMIKEVQDIKKNTNILTMYFLPVFMTILWSKLVPDLPDGFALAFGLLFLVVMVGMYVPSMMIAEEKEKKTIEVLLLSPATPADVFIGKGVLTIISMMVTGLIIILISGVNTAVLPVIFIGTFLTAIFSVFLGMIVGVLAPNQMATGVIGMPVYLLLLLVPQLSEFDIAIFKVLGKVLPTNYFYEMLRLSLEKGQGLDSMLTHVLVLILGIGITFITLLLVYRKKGLQ